VSVLVLAGAAVPLAARQVRSLAAAELVVAILSGIVWTAMIGRWPSGRNLVYGLFFLGVDVLAVTVPAVVATANDATPAWSGGPTVGQVIAIHGIEELLLYGIVAMLAVSVSAIVRKVARITGTPAARSRRASLGWVSTWAVLGAITAISIRIRHLGFIAGWRIPLVAVALCVLVGIHTGTRARRLGRAASVLGMNFLGVVIATIVVVVGGLGGLRGMARLPDVMLLLLLMLGLAAFVIATTAALVSLGSTMIHATRRRAGSAPSR
jgi:hypothetical protein